MKLLIPFLLLVFILAGGFSAGSVPAELPGKWSCDSLYICDLNSTWQAKAEHPDSDFWYFNADLTYRHVSSFGEMGKGTYRFDEAKKKLYVFNGLKNKRDATFPKRTVFTIRELSASSMLLFYIIKGSAGPEEYRFYFSKVPD